MLIKKLLANQNTRNSIEIKRQITEVLLNQYNINQLIDIDVNNTDLINKIYNKLNKLNLKD